MSLALCSTCSSQQNRNTHNNSKNNPCNNNSSSQQKKRIQKPNNCINAGEIQYPLAIKNLKNGTDGAKKKIDHKKIKNSENDGFANHETAPKS